MFLCVFTTVFPCIVKVCVCFSVYCTTVFVWMWVSVSALLVQVFSLSSGERGTKKVLEWKKESSTALIPTVTKYHPGCPREGWEGHPGGGGPPVGGQDVLQLPGPRKPLPHHGVPARRWCFPLSFFLPFTFLSFPSRCEISNLGVRFFVSCESSWGRMVVQRPCLNKRWVPAFVALLPIPLNPQDIAPAARWEWEHPHERVELDSALYKLWDLSRFWLRQNCKLKQLFSSSK